MLVIIFEKHMGTYGLLRNDKSISITIIAMIMMNIMTVITDHGGNMLVGHDNIAQ